MIKFIPVTIETVVSTDTLTAEFVSELKRVSNEIKNDLMKPTATWENKPTFVSQINVTPAEITMDIYLAGDSPGNLHYLWLDDGTKEHVIKSDVTHIRMPKTFSPKSIPGTLAANQGGYSGEFTFLPYGYPVVSSITARKFIEQVAEIWEKKMEDAGARVIRSVSEKL